ncbi:MAG: cupin domain-containing protein [Methanobacteriota archaeon]|nr:MAG: cupin domain-containing protein [Euryarchaeota archaeon]
MFWFVLQCFGRLRRRATSSRRLGYHRATPGLPEPRQDLPHDLHPDRLSRLFVSPFPGRVMPGIDVVRGTGLKEGQSTPGILREQAFESSNVLVSRTRLDPAAVSGWHHHGTHDLYGFLLSGRLRLEYGTTGSEAVTVSPGDFIHIPPGLVHRDVNPDRARGLIVVNILVGSGVRVVNLDRP